MPIIEWDASGERYYETGVDHGVLYPKSGSEFTNGVAWNGLISVNESPSGAEPSPIYADNIKYLNLVSVEELGATVEAYTYPTEFAECDGTALIGSTGGAAAPFSGIAVGQQRRKEFGLSYRTRIGNDEDMDDHGYKLHLLYNALAAPSEKAYSTVNDSPEAVTFSWTLTTTALPFTSAHSGLNLRPTSLLTIDSRLATEAFLAKLNAALYGTESEEPYLPTPSEILEMHATP